MLGISSLQCVCDPYVLSQPLLVTDPWSKPGEFYLYKGLHYTKIRPVLYIQNVVVRSPLVGLLDLLSRIFTQVYIYSKVRKFQLLSGVCLPILSFHTDGDVTCLYSVV